MDFSDIFLRFSRYFCLWDFSGFLVFLGRNRVGSKESDLCRPVRFGRTDFESNHIRMQVVSNNCDFSIIKTIVLSPINRKSDGQNSLH